MHRSITSPPDLSRSCDGGAPATPRVARDGSLRRGFVVDTRRASNPVSRLALALALAMALATTSATTHAQAESARPEEASSDRERRAQAIYAEGVTAFEEERFEQALERFQEAYELVRLPAFVFNQASCLDRLGRKREAVARYEAYLIALPEAANRSYAESRLTLLRAELAELATTQTAPDATTRAEEPESAPPAPLVRRRTWTGPALVLGVGVAAGLAAVGTGLRALALRADLEAVCMQRRCPPEEAPTGDRMARFALATDVLLGIAGAAAAAGLLWAVLGGRRSTPPMSASCGPRGCEASLSWSF